MKKTFLFFILSIFVCILRAQTNLSTEMLNGTEWRLVWPSDAFTTTTLCFSDKQMTMTYTFEKLNKCKVKSYFYYFSSEIPNSFNPQTVGKKTIGNFLICSTSTKLICFEVLTYNKSEMKLIYKPLKGEVTVGEIEPFILKKK